MKHLFYFFGFAGLSLVLGLGSAYLLVDDGFALITSQTGPWKTWSHAGSLTADPYTRAHIARSGDLPITSASGLIFQATTDSEGRDLSSSCEYEIIIRPFSAVWWSIALYNADGRLIPNKAGRHAFNAQNLTVLPDGTQRISLAPRARPGHWLPSGKDHDLRLVLRIIRPLSVEQRRHGAGFQTLPDIQRIAC
jgi:hypothetical protein